MKDDGYRLYPLQDGWEALVGKSARDNDRLSLKIGRPQDFWFHVAGMPGSHVVVRHPDRPDQCPREIRKIGAGLAAFFSKARSGGRVSVHWTTCQNVSKRRGAPAGEVLLRKFEKTFAEPIDPKINLEETRDESST